MMTIEFETLYNNDFHTIYIQKGFFFLKKKTLNLILFLEKWFYIY